MPIQRIIAASMLTVSSYASAGLDRLAQLLARYVQCLPHAKVMPAEFYTYHPALAPARNAIAVWDGQGEMAGFAPLFVVPVDADVPAETPHTIWSVMFVDPAQPNPQDVRDCLFQAAVARSRELIAALSPRRTRLAADLMACQQDEIADLRRRGFVTYAQVAIMERTLDGMLPAHPVPAGVRLVWDRLASAGMQAHYVDAYNACFPHSPKTCDSLRFLLESPGWVQGGAVTAWAGDQLVGSVMVYGAEMPGAASVDDLFVLPVLRRQGLARSLLCAGLEQAREQGAVSARLEVDMANAPAMRLYQGAGFRVVDEEVLLGLDLATA